MSIGLQVTREVKTRIPTEYGDFNLSYYSNSLDDKEHLAFVCGDIAGKEKVLVRVHSECFTGDLLGSKRCDCGEQLQRSIQMIAQEGSGAVIYLRQEGRGIGLLEKLRAYNLQDEGYDTVDANLVLGHEVDPRDYSIAAAILKDLEVTSIRLITNNPFKIERLINLGIDVRERVVQTPTINEENKSYLQTKIDRMNHLFHMPDAILESQSKQKNGDQE